MRARSKASLLLLALCRERFIRAATAPGGQHFRTRDHPMPVAPCHNANAAGTSSCLHPERPNAAGAVA